MTYYSELASFFAIIAVNLILIGSPIAVGIFIVLRLTRAVAPRARYLLTLTAFFAAAVLPFVVTVTLPAETTRQPTTVALNTDSTTVHQPPSVDTQANQIEVLRETERSVTTVNILNPLLHFLSRPSISVALVTLWLIGAGLLLGREAGGHLRVAKARRQWTPAKENIRARLSWPNERPLFVDNEFGPCALGVFDSVVIIPAGIFDELSDGAAQQIAHHELNHLKWRDPSVNATMRIVLALLWPSVPLWYLARATALEREAASDRAAVNSMSGRVQQDIAALEYASTLISIARRCARVERRRRYGWIATDLGNESGLNERIQRLMAVSSRPTGARLSLAFVTLLMSASSLVVMPVARLESTRQENSNPREEQQQIALTKPAQVEAKPAKVQLKKPALFSPGISSPGNSQTPGEAPEGSNSPATGADPVQSGLATPTASIAATDSPNPIPQIQDLRIEILKNQMASIGYKDLTSRQLAEMLTFAVGPAYVAEMADSGYSGLSADMLILFKRLAVNSSYIKEMRTLGYDNLSPRMMVYFRECAVSPDYIRQMRSRISGSISAEEMASLRFYGASIEFVDKLKQMGYANLNAGQLISMRLQGVSIDFIEALNAQGRQDLTVNELIALKLRRSH